MSLLACLMSQFSIIIISFMESTIISSFMYGCSRTISPVASSFISLSQCHFQFFNGTLPSFIRCQCPYHFNRFSFMTTTIEFFTSIPSLMVSFLRWSSKAKLTGTSSTSFRLREVYVRFFLSVIHTSDSYVSIR